MAVFRSVENRVPSVRSTASGVTCIISPEGKIEKAAPEFCQAYIIGKVPVIEGDITTFTRFGDVAGIVEVSLAVLILIIQSIVVIIQKVIKKQ